MQFCAVPRNICFHLIRSSRSSFPANFFQSPGGPSAATASFRHAAIAAFAVSSMALIASSARAATGPPRTVRLSSVCTPFAKLITPDARRFSIPAAWICAVINAESAGDVHAISPKGAIGLMQLMPQTWALLRRRYHLGANPESPRDNIFVGTAYLRALLDRYGAPGFLAAYNAGPAQWQEHLATGAKLPIETQAYLARLLPIIDGDNPGKEFVAVSTRSWSTAPLFPALLFSAPIAAANHPPIQRKITGQTAFAPHADGLFVTASAQKFEP